MTGFFAKRGGVEFRPYGPVTVEAIEQKRTDAAELDALLKATLTAS